MISLKTQYHQENLWIIDDAVALLHELISRLPQADFSQGCCKLMFKIHFFYTQTVQKQPILNSESIKQLSGVDILLMMAFFLKFKN